MTPPLTPPFNLSLTLSLTPLLHNNTDMLSYPGSTHLVVTHKSLLRAMLCAALGLPPRQFRAIDLSNGAVCMVRWVGCEGSVRGVCFC